MSANSNALDSKDPIVSLERSETLKIRKDATTLINDHYKDPKTMLFIFHFEPYSFTSSLLRIKNSQIQHLSIEGKDIYLLDHFFSKSESLEMRNFSENTGFSRSIFASPESEENGERPARSMDSKERWKFFSNPPQAINEVYKLFGTLAQLMDAEITTLPWDLCHQTKSSAAIATNFVEEMSSKSTELGKHKDYNPEKGLFFTIPKLYSEPQEFHPSCFVNGEIGRPWLISVMVYSTSEEFLPEYGMGTTYYKNDGTFVVKSDCVDMRIVFFEGDIIHSIEESALHLGSEIWRVSYVFKLILNPRRENQNIKEIFLEVMKKERP